MKAWYPHGIGPGWSTLTILSMGSPGSWPALAFHSRRPPLVTPGGDGVAQGVDS